MPKETKVNSKVSTDTVATAELKQKGWKVVDKKEVITQPKGTCTCEQNWGVCTIRYKYPEDKALLKTLIASRFGYDFKYCNCWAQSECVQILIGEKANILHKA